MDYLQYERFGGNKTLALFSVLNLIINGLPSIHEQIFLDISFQSVLNLIINGLPSIQF